MNHKSHINRVTNDKYIQQGRCSQRKQKQRGFTLVELIAVIILLGIGSVGITSIIQLSTQSYVNIADRDELIASARFAVERLNREIRNAVPNSARVKTSVFAGKSISCLEFVPITASTSYTDIPVSPEPLSTTLKVAKFKGKDGNDYACTGSCLDSVVVYPLNSNDIFADQSDATGKVFGLNLVDSTGDEWTLTVDKLSPGVSFDSESPTSRLYIVTAPVSYCVTDQQIYRYENYAYTVNQVAPPQTTKIPMGNNIVNMDLGELPFTVVNASLQRNALVQIKLHFAKNDEDFVFNNEVHINNVP
jgi:MSHA biogenesis protein MshO